MDCQSFINQSSGIVVGAVNRLQINERGGNRWQRRFWQLIAIFANKIKRLLEQLASLTNRKKKSAARLTKNSKIIKTIIAAIQEKKRGEYYFP